MLKRWMFVVLIVIFASVFLISGGYLLNYYVNSRQAQAEFDDLASLVESIQAQQPTVPETTAPAQEDSSVSTQPTAPQVLAPYAPVYEINPDMVGWIKIDGTKINYPVVQSSGRRDYYLKRSFTGEYSVHGTIYVKEECNVFRHTDNVTVYGHRMNDGSMFADLLKYKDAAFWQEHRYITFDNLYEQRTYEVFAAFSISDIANFPFQYHRFVDAQNAEEFDDFVNNCKKYAAYDTGITPTYGDKLLTLSTCERYVANGRVVVFARLVQE